MYKMKYYMMAAISFVLLTACSSSQAAQEPTPEKVAVAYTHLVGESSQQKINDVLAHAGVSEQRRTVLFDHVKQFNAAVDTSKLANDFVENNPAEKTYDPYDLQDQWAAKHPDFEGYNCRITTFALFGDFVTSDSNGDIRDHDLFLDLIALEQDNSGLVGSDVAEFSRVFSTIPTSNTKDIATHVQHIQADWQQRGITFKENANMTMITVWLHNQLTPGEDELFIGHVGVLVRYEGRLWFIEKIAFQEPFQATYFNDMAELHAYLMTKYDVEWGQPTAKPFVMENDKLVVQ